VAEGLERHTERTVCDQSAIEAEMQRVREQGHALDIEEYASGLMCFAAPIYDYSDAVVGTLGVSVFTLHYTLQDLRERLGPQVMQAALTASLQMGMSEKHRDRFTMDRV
jgi:DNA-binding IclR family transcriptional regulator